MKLRHKLNRARTILSDSRWWFFKLQRLVLEPSRRQQIADFIAARRPRYAANSARDHNAAESRSQLLGDGQIIIPNLLSSDQIARLREYFTAKPVTYTYDTTIPAFLPGSDNRPAHVHVAHHDARDVLQAPGLIEVANHPAVLAHVAAALGCVPTLSYMTAWWSYPTNLGAVQAENFHRDVDDWAFFKLFVYLSDVDETTGPHVYVRNSAASLKLSSLGRFTDEEVMEQFGSDSIISLCAPAGTALIENTFGLHKAMPLQRGTRLMFQAVYSIFPMFYGPKNPVVVARDLPRMAQENRWINRVYVS